MANLTANASIITGLPMPQPERMDPYAPDVNGPIPADVPTLMMSSPAAIPPNFDELPKEEQELLMAQYRFGGIPCRPDLPGTIPITRETLDIP